MGFLLEAPEMQQSEPIIYENQEPSDTLLSYGSVFYVGKYAGLQIEFEGNQEDHLLAIDWVQFGIQSLPGVPTVVHTTFWHVQEAKRLTVFLPNHAAFVQIGVVAAAAGGNHSLVVIPSNRAIGSSVSARTNESAPLFNRQNENVNAGATENYDLAYSYAGPAFLWMVTASPNGTVAVEWRDYSSDPALAASWNTLAQYGTASQNRTDILYIPPRICRVRLLNSDAGARAFWASLMPLHA